MIHITIVVLMIAHVLFYVFGGPMYNEPVGTDYAAQIVTIVFRWLMTWVIVNVLCLLIRGIK